MCVTTPPPIVSTFEKSVPALIELLKSPDGLPRCLYELESLKKTLEPKGPRIGYKR
jgi:hypothetical protein